MEVDNTQAVKEVMATRFRNIIVQVSGKTISTEQVIDFLDLFEGDYRDAHAKADRDFAAKHFGVRDVLKK